MSVTDDLVAHAKVWQQRFEPEAQTSPQPRCHLAIVACMDARLDLFGILGLAVGDAHLLRNAGGVVTDDMIRSLAISQRKLGTREIILIHHTDCGMTRVTDDGFKDGVEQETGIRPAWAVESFSDPEANVRQSINRIRHSPFLPHRDAVRGFVYEVDTGVLHEVS
jgi:carbonic anhydrase